MLSSVIAIDDVMRVLLAFHSDDSIYIVFESSEHTPGTLQILFPSDVSRASESTRISAGHDFRKLDCCNEAVDDDNVAKSFSTVHERAERDAVQSLH